NRQLPHHDVTLFKLSPFEGTEIYDQLGGYDHYENLGAATFYKYKKSIISDVSPDFLEGFVKNFGLKFYFSKDRMQKALEFTSPNISREDIREHFQTIYNVAKIHYGIKEDDLEDMAARNLLSSILNPAYHS